jgi:hypothetical protein
VDRYGVDSTLESVGRFDPGRLSCVVSIRRRGARRWLIGVAAALTIVAATCLVIGFMIPPAASTDELPQSITVGDVVYERVHLITLTTKPRRETVAAQVPATSRPIVVRASCRLAVLHSGSALSALMLELRSMRIGGDQNIVPDTQGAEYLACPPRPGQHLMQTIDPAWLPRNEDQLQLKWFELPTYADAPSDSAASWALAVYVAR